MCLCLISGSPRDIEQIELKARLYLLLEDVALKGSETGGTRKDLSRSVVAVCAKL